MIIAVTEDERTVTMALIDRQTLIDSFCSQCTVDKPETCSTIRYGDKWCNEVYTILNAPTVDAVPVRHGYWIRHENADVVDGYLVPNFECSECHSWKEDDSDYCPDCGVKLDRKDGEQP